MDCVGMKEGASAEEAKQASGQGLTQKLEIPATWIDANTVEAEF